MSNLEAIILGLIQAMTEFLPVSSSGHLVLFQDLLGVTEANLAFDILLHLATLIVVFVYLGKDIFRTLKHLPSQGEEGLRARRLALLVVLASVPAAIVGLGLKDLVREAFKSVHVAGIGFLITTTFLLLADKIYGDPDEDSNETDDNWPLPSVKQALIIGCAQAIAITPGVSRSGSTIASALLVGLPVRSALKFSFFISIPAILGAGLLEIEGMKELANSNTLPYCLGFLVATGTGFFALRMLVLVTNSRRLKYFAGYTALLALIALLK